MYVTVFGSNDVLFFVDNILLFVSAGEHQHKKGNPLEVIREENEALQNRVVINTFGIGTGRCITV